MQSLISQYTATVNEFTWCACAWNELDPSHKRMLEVMAERA